jgi:hypothetical protein
MSLNIPDAKDLRSNNQSEIIAEQIRVIEDAFKDAKPTDEIIVVTLKSELNANLSQQLRDKGYNLGQFYRFDVNSTDVNNGRYLVKIYLGETPIHTKSTRSLFGAYYPFGHTLFSFNRYI